MGFDEVEISDHGATQIIRVARQGDAFLAMAHRAMAGDTQDWV